MTAWPEARRGGFVAAVVTRAEGWLLEPAAPRPRPRDPEATPRSVFAVIGLASGCGTSTIARALGVELARRDPGGAAVVSGDLARGAPVPAVATAQARRLARALPPGTASAAGRLCLVARDDPAVRELALDRPAPVVLDVAHGDPPECALALADGAILVAGPLVEPALADVVAASLGRGGGSPLVVLNRALDADAWEKRGAFLVGDARLGARLALAGRDPTPGLARPVAELADRLLGEDSS